MLNTFSEWCGVAAVSSIALVKFAPQYSILQSYLWTAAGVLATEWLIWAIYTIVIYPHYLSPLRHLPQPTENNSYFNGQFATIRKEASGIPARRWLNSIPNQGLSRYNFLFNKERVLLTNPKALAEVLTTKSYIFVKPEGIRHGLGRILGYGILLAEGDEHKHQRKHLMPAFSFRHIKELYPIFWEKAHEMNRKIEQQMKIAPFENAIEIGNWVSRATLDIIGIAGLGRDFDTIENPNNELSKNYVSVLTPTRTGRMLGLIGLFLPAWIVDRIPVKHNDNLNACARSARDTSREMIHIKKMEMQEKGRMDNKDIVSIALESGAFSEDDLVDQMMTFLIAGHETTATSMQWAIYALCQHPEIQTRLRAEVHQHLSPSQPLTAEVLDHKLPYLHAFCQETLRFYAAVSMTQRVASIDTTILGQYIPKGTLVIICPWAVNYSKALWGDDAETFDPERWMGPGKANTGGASSNYAFLTFNHGPRSCIGSGFAKAEFMAMVAAWVGKWEFELVDPDAEIVIKGGITAKPRGGTNIKIKSVEWE